MTFGFRGQVRSDFYKFDIVAKALCTFLYTVKGIYFTTVPYCSDLSPDLWCAIDLWSALCHWPVHWPVTGPMTLSGSYDPSSADLDIGRLTMKLGRFLDTEYMSIDTPRSLWKGGNVTFQLPFKVGTN